jgi:hypothetical protein
MLLRLTSIKVNCSVSVKPKTIPTYMPSYSDMGLDAFQLAILVFRLIIGDWHEKLLRKDFRNVRVVGKKNYYPSGEN